MSRVPRKSFNTSFFHVICQGYEKQYIFSKATYKELYLSFLKKYRDEFNIEILSYCIMDNHVHILLNCNTIEDMSHFMKKVNCSFARSYNKIEKRVGYVFRDRFYTQPIYNEKQLLSCVAYIHNNPVIAGVSKIDEYKYSSYNDFALKRSFVNDNVIRFLFGSEFDYYSMFECIHRINCEGIDLKIDVPKLSIDEAKKIIISKLNMYAISELRYETDNVKAFFLKLFLREGITVYQIEKVLNISHQVSKRILKAYS